MTYMRQSIHFILVCLDDGFQSNSWAIIVFKINFSSFIICAHV